MKKETNETIFEGGFGISFDLKDPVAVDFIVNKTIRIRDAYGLQYKRKDLPIILRKIKNQLIDGYMYPRTLRMVAERIVDDLLGMVDINIKQASLISSTEILEQKDTQIIRESTTPVSNRKNGLQREIESPVLCTKKCMERKSM